MLDKRVEVFTLAVFPLPACVFFPNTMLPLHIFEPRYRAMTADALAGSRELSVAMLEAGYESDYHGRPPIHRVAGAGIIVGDERLPDGRYNLMLQGVDRVQVVEELATDRSYRTARVRRLADRYPAGGPERLGVEAEALRRIFGKLIGALPEAPDTLVDMAARAPSPGALADMIASVAVPDAAIKQSLLECLDVAERLQTVTDAVARLLLHVSETSAAEVADDDDDEGTGGPGPLLH